MTPTLESPLDTRARHGGPAGVDAATRTATATDLDAQVDRHRAAVHAQRSERDGLVDATVSIDPTHYALLDLPEGASAADIHRAITRLGLAAAAAHAVVRVGGVDAALAARQLAAAVLSDAARRHVYDQWLQRERRQRARWRAQAESKAGRWARWGRRYGWLALGLVLLLWYFSGGLR